MSRCVGSAAVFVLGVQATQDGLGFRRQRVLRVTLQEGLRRIHGLGSLAQLGMESNALEVSEGTPDGMSLLSQRA